MLMDEEGSALEETEGWAGGQRLPEKLDVFSRINALSVVVPPVYSRAGKRPVGGVTRARHGADRGGNARGRRGSPLRTSRAPMRVSGTFASPRAVPIAILGSVFSWPEGAPQYRKRVDKKAAGKAGGARRATAGTRGGGSRAVAWRVTELGEGTHLFRVRGRADAKGRAEASAVAFDGEPVFRAAVFRNVGAQANSLLRRKIGNSNRPSSMGCFLRRFFPRMRNKK